MSDEFERGGSRTVRGWTVALALPATGGSGLAATPDLHRFWLWHAGKWSLRDIRPLCAAAGVRLPVQVTHPWYADAHEDRLVGIAVALATIDRVRRERAATPAARPEPPRPAFYWLDL